MKDINEFYVFYEEKLKEIIEKNSAVRKIFKRMDIGLAVIVFFIGLWLSYWFHSYFPIAIFTIVALRFLLKSGDTFAYPDYRIRFLSSIVSFMSDNFYYRRHDSMGIYHIDNSGMFFEDIDKYEVNDIIVDKSKGKYITLAFVRGYQLGMLQSVYIILVIALVLSTFFISAVLIGSYDKNADLSENLMVPVMILGAIIISLLLEWLKGGQDSIWNLVHALFSENKRREKKTVFEGLFLSMDFNKEFHGHTIGIPRSLSGKFTTLKVPDTMQEEELENADFMSKFYIYSTNSTEARYLLTPLLMEALTGLSNRLSSPMNFSFHGGRLFVMFEQDDLLKTVVFNEIDEFDGVAKLYITLSDIMETASYLGLDRRIWTKK